MEEGTFAITSPTVNLAQQADRLLVHAAALDHRALALQGLGTEPSADLLHQLQAELTPVFRAIEDLLPRAAALDRSAREHRAESRGIVSVLALVRQSMSAASEAALALTGAVTVTADALADGSDARIPSVASRVREELEPARDYLKDGGAACRVAATDLARLLEAHPALRPALPTLTAAQYACLGKIAHHDTRVSSFSRSRGPSVHAGDQAIHPKPFQALKAHALITVSHSASPLGSQRVRVTTAGRLALRAQKPTAPPNRPAAKNPAPRR
ncbi:hypothetical protein [Streptomyces sp. GZWMJZ-114]|uniref:hypothetical protein n=1 Tax=Streptomyces sp. GZWMJZ-114 TaxID=2494734 RepID=UPI00101315F9|nr:hypothetical protein [Streptomyces sp. GZWMJZ-114]